MLSAVVCLSHRVKLAGAVNASFAVFEDALESGRLPAAGKVSDRLVRSAFSALGRSAPELRLQDLPSPFVSPHNLSWYFGTCTCPTEVRLFVTSLGRRHLRVWSVARAEEGWRVLVQVFGAASKAKAVGEVELEMMLPSRRLRNYVASAAGYRESLRNFDEFLHEKVRFTNLEYGKGTFVEVTLRGNV